MLPREGHRFDVDVIEDLEVVGDESNRAHQGTPHAGACQCLEEVRTQPRLAGVARGLESELPFRELRTFGHEPAALQEPFAISIACGLDPGWQAVRGEEDRKST